MVLRIYFIKSLQLQLIVFRKTPSDPFSLGRFPFEPAKFKYRTKMNNIKHIASYLWLLWSPFLVIIAQVLIGSARPNRPPQWLVSCLSPLPTPPSADWLTDLYRARINNIEQIAIACLGMSVCSASKVIWSMWCGDKVWMKKIFKCWCCIFIGHCGAGKY